MSHGLWLQDDVKGLIKEIFLANRHISAPKAREELLKRMKAKGLDYTYGSDYPRISTVANQLRKLRDQDAARTDGSKALDEPWSFGSLAQHPIPPEAMSVLVSIYWRSLGEDDHITIREALWIARLCEVVRFGYQRQMAMFADPDSKNTRLAIRYGTIPENYRDIKFEDVLLDWGYVYAQHELWSELDEEEFDSNELDGYIAGHTFEYYGERRRDAIYGFADEHGTDERTLWSLNSLGLGLGQIGHFAAKIGNEECRVFSAPYEVLRELQDYTGHDLEWHSLGPGEGDSIIIAIKETIPAHLLLKLEHYQIFYSKGVQDERIDKAEE